jgi:hypothetical protein
MGDEWPPRVSISRLCFIRLTRSSINCQSNSLIHNQVQALKDSTLECESQPGAVSTEPRALAFMDGTSIFIIEIWR